MNSTNNIGSTADLKSYYNYYAFGMLQAGRDYRTADDYNFGFGGQMRDDEIAGDGNNYTAECWQYDPRRAQRWNTDPLWEKRRGQSPYSAFNNAPTIFNDPTGETGIVRIEGEQVVVSMHFHFYGDIDKTTANDIVAKMQKTWNDANGTVVLDDGNTYKVAFEFEATTYSNTDDLTLKGEGLASKFFGWSSDNDPYGVNTLEAGMAENAENNFIRVGDMGTRSSFSGGNTGYFNKNELFTTTPSHELGHLLAGRWHTPYEGGVPSMSNARGSGNFNTKDRIVTQKDIDMLQINKVLSVQNGITEGQLGFRTNTYYPTKDPNFKRYNHTLQKNAYDRFEKNMSQ